METTSKVSLELTARKNLERRGSRARAKLSILEIVHKPLHSLQRVINQSCTPKMYIKSKWKTIF